MQKAIKFLFATAITLTVGLILMLFSISLSNADSGLAFQELRKTAVMVNGLNCSGSGSVVEGKSGKHYILTNQHVCNCARYKHEIDVTFEGGGLLRAQVVKGDFTKDLCAAKVDDTLPALKLGVELLPFTEVNTRGYPGARLAESHGTTKGNIGWDFDMDISEVGVCPKDSTKGYGLNGNISACRLHFISTLTNLYGRPGSSGSAVVNNDGKLVGVVSSFHPDDDYDAGIVTFQDVREFLSTL